MRRRPSAEVLYGACVGRVHPDVPQVRDDVDAADPTPANHVILRRLKANALESGLSWLCFGGLLFRGLPFRFLLLLAFLWLSALGIWIATERT